MITIRVSTGTIAALDRRHAAVREAIKNLDDRRRILQEIKRGQVERWAQDFLSGGDPAWTPTSASYQETREREGYSATPTLIRSGATMQHFMSQNQEGRVNAASITWDFFNEEGAYTVSHHTGYTLGNSVVPARMLWDIDAQDEAIIEGQIEDFVEEQFRDL